MPVCTTCGRIFGDETSACPACGAAAAGAGSRGRASSRQSQSYPKVRHSPSAGRSAGLAPVGLPPAGASRPAPQRPGTASAGVASPPLGGIGLGVGAARRSRGSAWGWHMTVQWIVAALITALLAYLTYSRNGWVPLLSSADLAIHEFGHMIFAWAPEMVVQAAGSFLQVAVPLFFAIFFWWHRDHFAVVLMLAWAGESLNNVSVYIDDAQRMVLPLFGDDGSGAGHDWHNLLTETGMLEHTQTVASVVRGLSVGLFALAIGLTIWWFAKARRTR